jgi:hypothetical protein
VVWGERTEGRAEGSSDVFRSGEGGDGVNYWYFLVLEVLRLFLRACVRDLGLRFGRRM